MTCCWLVVRQILSLENRSEDLIENNKKLLNKIYQLEKTEADAGAEIDALRHENARLATQADTFGSTVASQSSLIIGLRTTVQRLTVCVNEYGRDRPRVRLPLSLTHTVFHSLHLCSSNKSRT